MSAAPIRGGGLRKLKTRTRVYRRRAELPAGCGSRCLAAEIPTSGIYFTEYQRYPSNFSISDSERLKAPPSRELDDHKRNVWNLKTCGLARLHLIAAELFGADQPPTLKDMGLDWA